MIGLLRGNYALRPLLGATLAIMVFCGLAGSGPSSLAGREQGLPPGHWVPSFDDEFNSPAGLAQWSYWTGYSNADGQGSLQWYDRQNASVKDGNLVMTAARGYNGHRCWYGPCRYTSVSMNTKRHFAQARGFFEARIKVPVEHGIWPAFWMTSDRPSKSRWSSGELDILEINGRTPPNMVGAFGHTATVFHRVECTLSSPLSAAYHTYALEWDNRGITWFVDGNTCGQRMNAYRGWPFNYPFHMLLNMAVGGHWPGDPDASTHFPVRMYVDWVRVFRQA